MNGGVADGFAATEGEAANSTPYAFGGPVGRGRIRQTHEDFRVDECLGFNCTGQGEHLLLRVEKSGSNTEQVARCLARVAGIPYRDVGYAGLKDRRAVCRQWFSLRLPCGREVDWSRMDDPAVRVLETYRNSRKLRRGALTENRFRIVVRGVHVPRETVETRLQRVFREGVPNYFGPQRFGRERSNLRDSRAFLAGELKVRDRYRRGLLLSSARSELFNRILAERVRQRNWNSGIDGDAMMFDGSGAYFGVERIDDEVRHRLERRAIHPSGALWGSGESPVQADALRLETGVTGNFGELCSGLERYGLKMGRRALRLQPRAPAWRWLETGVLEVEFALVAGGYATSVLREILDVDG